MTKPCKVSFQIDCDKLTQVETFAASQGMNVSEAFRFIVDCGIEAVTRAGFDVKPLPLGHGATRGKFPAPERRGKDGAPS